MKRRIRLVVYAAMSAYIVLAGCEGFEQPSGIGAAPAAIGSPSAFGDLNGRIPRVEPVVLHVTSLENEGEGTLREMLELKSGPRRIVFDLSGTISLDDAIAVRNPFVSVDGLSAPDPGITLEHYGLKIRTHNVKVSHLRIHIGDENKIDNPDFGDHDAIDIAGNDDDMPVRDIIIDHCSMYWAIDESACTWSGDFRENVTDVLFTDCIFGEALLNSIHSDGPHSCGPMVGHNSKRIFLVRNLIAHCADRNPAIYGGTTSFVANNVIYDPMNTFIHINNSHGVEEPRATIIGNICIRGPSAIDPLRHSVRFSALGAGAMIYVEDNPCDAYVEGVPTSTIAHDMLDLQSVIVEDPPVWESAISILPSHLVEEHVLGNAGARPHDRDPTDNRLVRQVRTRTGGIISSQREIGSRGKSHDRLKKD